jgi:hypothetical protein
MTRRQTGCCFRPVSSLFSAADLPKSRAALALAYLMAKAARRLGPLASLQQEHQKKPVDQVIIQRTASYPRSIFSEKGSRKWLPSIPWVTQDGGHPISSFILPPFSIFFPPSLLYSTIILPRSTSPPSPSAGCHLLGQQAPPSHLLPYFFTFNRPRRRPLRLI